VLSVREAGKAASALDGHGVFTVVGQLRTEPVQSQRLLLVGRWEYGTRGEQFRVAAVSCARPHTAEGINAYLASGVLSGIGPVLAQRIVDRFGKDALTVLDLHPEQLIEIQGIGESTIEHIVKSWQIQKGRAAALTELLSLGLSVSLAHKALRQFGAEAALQIRTNAYCLAELHGVGFQRADSIARGRGMAKNDPDRLVAGLHYVLEREAGRGHSCLPREVLTKEAQQVLDVEVTELEAAVASASERGKLQEWERALYLPQLYHAERALEAGLRDLARQTFLPSRIELGAVERLALTPVQREAVARALNHGLSVIAGLPGTGKTMAVGYLLRQAVRLGLKVALAAPTGKAAKRAGEGTGLDGMTIHRLLEWHPRDGCRFNRRRPLRIDLLVVDEAPMMDLEMAAALVKALDPARTRLVFVGDIHQLPAVGAGQVLRDVIAANICPVTELVEIQRQTAGSQIVRLAHDIHFGAVPSLRSGSLGACEFLLRNEPEEVLAALRDILPRLPFRPQEIQVLAPMKRGPLGTVELNRVLQDVMNPGTSVDGVPFRVGDRVIHLDNDYKKQVFNGEIGSITEVSETERVLQVAFPDREVSYTEADWDDLALAYSLTVHKAQGSEFPCTVVVLHSSHYPMLTREVLYTAVTRAQKHLVYIGSPQAFYTALKRDQGTRRHSGLFRDSPLAVLEPFSHQTVLPA
jgi:exodeoxyribonuclease V alpha subunit